MDSFLDKFFRWLRFRKVIKNISKNSVVCDIGCGSDAVFLKKISNSIKFGFGFDKKIKDCNELKYELKNLKIDNKIPLKSESCDVITMIAVLEHLSNPQLLIDESFRILKKNGKLILTTPSPIAKPILEFLAFKLRLIDEEEIKDHKNCFWPTELKKIITKAGFEENNIKIYFFEIFLNNLIIAKK